MTMATVLKSQQINQDYMKDILIKLLNIPSPSGFTDEIVRFTCQELERLGIPYEITRRGGIRADLEGREKSPDRAIVAHLDTIGAMVKQLKDNGRLEIVPIGTWSSRFAEGARVTLFTDSHPYRGTILPIKAAGHTYNTQIDTLPVDWENIELRIDEVCHSRNDLEKLGINVGDFVAIDPQPEITPAGFINSRHLDDKAGVAVLLAVAKSVVDAGITLPVDCHLLLTISEEVGSGASAILHQDVAQMVTIDAGPSAPGQSTDEYGVTICMQDSAGPFDYHLTHKLIEICQTNNIPYRRDIFKYYRCDSASAIEAGNDIRTALVCFGTDATHGYERCHEKTLEALARLLFCYINSERMFARDSKDLGPLKGFPTLPVTREV
jgi:peptidase M42 family hydrolase